MKTFFKTIKVLLELTRHQTILLVLILLFSAMMPPLSLYSMEKLIDSTVNYIQQKGDISLTIFWGAITVIAFLVLALMTYAQTIQTLAIKKALYENYSETILKKFTHLQFSCFEDSSDHNVVKNMGDSPQEKILELLLNAITVIKDLISVIGFTILFIRISPWFSLFAILVLTLMIILHTKAMMMMEKLYVEQTKDERLLAYYDQILSDKKTLSELRINNAICSILFRQKIKAKNILDNRLKATIKSQLAIASSTIMFIIWLALIIFGLSTSLVSRTITIGMFVSLVASTNSIMSSCSSISENLSKFLRTNLRLIHYESFMALPSLSFTKSSQLNELDTPDKIIKICFKNVSFVYPGTDRKILDNVSFVLNGNECSAIVGYNGAGKSTIIKLLCRLYEPTSGNIYLNGIDIKSYSREEYYKLFGFMFQDFGRYYFTLRENVAFGDVKQLHNDQKIKHLLKLVKLDHFSSKLDRTMGNLWKDGMDMSGGQWQRIAIARGIIPSCKMIIFDEPTASLDPISEDNFYSIISNLMHQKGCILISHRLAAAKLSDQIVVLDQGRVVEQGSHQQLIQSNGIYSHMFDEQSKWYRDEV